MPNVPPAGPLGHFGAGFGAQRPIHWTVGPFSAWFWCPTSHPLDRWTTLGLVLVPNVPSAGPLDHFRPGFGAQRPIRWTVGPLWGWFWCPTSHSLDRWTTFCLVSMPNVPLTGPLDHSWRGISANNKGPESTPGLFVRTYPFRRRSCLEPLRWCLRRQSRDSGRPSCRTR